MEGSRAARRAVRDDLDSQPALTLRGLQAAARPQALWLGGTAGPITAFTLIYTMRQRPVYEASTTLRLAEHQNAGNPPDLFAGLSTQSTIETEVEILRSRQVAEDVVDALSLHVGVVAPVGPSRTALFKALRATPDVATGTSLVRRDRDGFSLTAPDGRTARAVYG